jgi:hypothetical protein
VATTTQTGGAKGRLEAGATRLLGGNALPRASNAPELPLRSGESAKAGEGRQADPSARLRFGMTSDDGRRVDTRTEGGRTPSKGSGESRWNRDAQSAWLSGECGQKKTITLTGEATRQAVSSKGTACRAPTGRIRGGAVRCAGVSWRERGAAAVATGAESGRGRSGAKRWPAIGQGG